MNPLKRGFLDTVKAVKKNKSLFALLVIIQILFIASISFVSINYQIKIYENVRGIIEPLESLDYDKLGTVESGEQLPVEEMMEKIISVTKDYKKMVKNIIEMIFLILGFFLVLNGLNWSIAHQMVKKNKIVFYWGKFLLISLVFLIPVSLSSYLVLKSFMGIETESFKLGIGIMGGVFLAVSYFMLIGFCLLGEKLKGLPKKIFLVGIKKIHWILLSLLCVLLLLLLSLVLIYFLRDSMLMILGGLVLIAVLVLGKLFLICVIKQINKNIY